MPVTDLFISEIVSLSADAVTKKLGRRETVIRVLKRLKIDAEPAADDFEAIYKYALVEWGVFKPERLLNFFRDPTVYEAFHRAFYANDPALFQQEADEVRQRFEESGRLVGLEYDPRREIDDFSAVFRAIVDRTRAPADVRRDYTRSDMQAKIDQILAHVEPHTDKGSDPQALREAIRPYLDTVVRRSSRLPLGPLDPSGRESAQLDLTQVFINLNAGQRVVTEASGQGSNWLHRRFAAAIAHVHHERQLVLLGDPGSGKSTLLRFLSFCLANNALEAEGVWLQKLSWMERQETTREKVAPVAWREAESGEWGVESDEWRVTSGEWGDKKEEGEEVERYWTADAPLPIYIELRHFAQIDFDPKSAVALWNYFAQRLVQEDMGEVVVALQTIAQGGGVIFLLDGVDEVPLAQRKAVWGAIDALSAGVYGGNRWITTCRVLSFAPEEAPVGLRRRRSRL